MSNKMFAKKQNSLAVEPAKLDSLIGSNLSLTGDISFANGLRVDGCVDGNVTGGTDEKNLLILSDKGQIVGRVQVHDAVINGSITGDLIVSHFLELQANARINGNISYRQLKMDCGAVINGKLDRLADDNQHKVLPLDLSQSSQRPAERAKQRETAAQAAVRSA